MRPQETLPARFEGKLLKDPYAPAIVLELESGRIRRWSRAAVEHRALRVASICLSRGTSTDARVGIVTTNRLDAMAAAYFTLDRAGPVPARGRRAGD